MYDIAIEDWEKETGQYLARDRKIKDLSTGHVYAICKVTRTGLCLQQIPYFKNKQEQPFEIDYSELLRAYREGIFMVEGFDACQEKELKIAITSLVNKIRIAEQQALINSRDNEYKQATEELNKIKSEKEEKKRMKEQALQARMDLAAEMETQLIDIELSLQ